MFENDPMTKYIIHLHEQGLFINELKKEHSEVPIEWYEEMLKQFIQMMEMYRDDSERHSRYMDDMEKYSKQIAKNLGIKIR